MTTKLTALAFIVGAALYFTVGAALYFWRAHRRRRRAERAQHQAAQLLADLADAQRAAEDRLIADNLDYEEPDHAPTA